MAELDTDSIEAVLSVLTPAERKILGEIIEHERAHFAQDSARGIEHDILKSLEVHIR